MTVIEKYGPTALKGLDLKGSAITVPSTCTGCEMGKSMQKPFLRSTKTMDQILQIVHSDLVGPMRDRSIQGSLYFTTFIDNHLHHAVVYCIRSKDQFVVTLCKFLAWANNQTSKKLCVLHSDREGKYIAASVKTILDERGIKYHLTMPGLPQQNGKAERFNCTIVDKAMAILHASGLSQGFWKYVISAAVHIYN